PEDRLRLTIKLAQPRQDQLPEGMPAVHGHAILRGGRRKMTFQPLNQVVDKAIRVGLEFQRVVGIRIFDDVLVAGREALDISAGAVIDDDAILPGQHEQNRHGNVFSAEAEVAIQAGAFQKQPGAGQVQAKRIVREKLLPARLGGEKSRIVQRGRENRRRTKKPGPSKPQTLTKRTSDLTKKTRTNHGKTAH